MKKLKLRKWVKQVILIIVAIILLNILLIEPQTINQFRYNIMIIFIILISFMIINLKMN